LRPAAIDLHDPVEVGSERVEDHETGFPGLGQSLATAGEGHELLVLLIDLLLGQQSGPAEATRGMFVEDQGQSPGLVDRTGRVRQAHVGAQRGPERLDIGQGRSGAAHPCGRRRRDLGNALPHPRGVAAVGGKDVAVLRKKMVEELVGRRQLDLRAAERGVPLFGQLRHRGVGELVVGSPQHQRGVVRVAGLLEFGQAVRDLVERLADVDQSPFEVTLDVGAVRSAR
jgi:hypothetical protein